MSRPRRHVHPGGSRFEITTRAVQSRFLIPTGAHFRSIAIGIMARAKELYPVELYAFGGLSSHLLCAAAHNMCYVEGLVMWSGEPRPNAGGGIGGGFCT